MGSSFLIRHQTQNPCTGSTREIPLLCLMIAILTGVRCYLTVVLIGMSLMISNVEHFFMCLLAILRSSLELVLLLIFKSDCWGRGCLLLSFVSCLYLLDINPLSSTWFAEIFSHAIECFFHYAGAFEFNVISFVDFYFYCLCFWCHVQKSHYLNSKVIFREEIIYFVFFSAYS